ncbi:cytochrome P450 72A397-like [Rhododendron vialii]|uniref:cytochrome P450 72A397-like n=1 Tax=Rhododendron vialii TaxID=182163 RepID=UPI00265E6981|nr:cytochrome P450 72A397-like [Rhododendron vialii]
MFWALKERFDSISCQLRVVRIIGFRGKDLEISFVSYLIINATVLDELVIQCNDDCSRAGAIATRGLLSVPRASIDVRIVLKPGNDYLAKEVLENGSRGKVGMNLEEVIENCKAFCFAGQEIKHLKFAAVDYGFAEYLPRTQVQLLLPAMYSSCCEMTSKWEALVSTKGSCELDVWPYLCNLTADVISRTAFGSNYEEGKLIFELQKEQAHIVMQRLQSIYIPGWRFLPTKTNKKMNKIYNEMGALLHNMINNKLRTMNGEDGCTDLLGMILKSYLKDKHQKQESQNITLTIEDIIDECKVFYLAGQETTAVLLVWAMVLLSKHQKWQALAREEVLVVFGDNKPVFDGLNQLKTVTMILHEVLRLYPPATYILRSVNKNTMIGGLALPAGVEIIVPTIAIHHDPEIWGKDANDFKPERFSEGISKAMKVPGTFLPFGGVPRICIGQNFALVEAKIALAVILKRFSFQLSPSYVHAPSLVLAVQPQHGARLILQKII